MLLALLLFSSVAKAQTCKTYQAAFESITGSAGHASCGVAASAWQTQFDSQKPFGNTVVVTGSSLTTASYTIYRSNGTIFASIASNTCLATTVAGACPLTCAQRSGTPHFMALSGTNFVSTDARIEGAGTSPQVFFCSGGCYIEANRGACFGEGAARYCNASDARVQGATCEAGAANPTTPPSLSPTAADIDDKSGMCEGTINATVVKYKCASSDQTTTITTATANVTSTAVTTTVCKNGVCTTTTTVTANTPPSLAVPLDDPTKPYSDRPRLRIGIDGTLLNCATGCAVCNLSQANPGNVGNGCFSNAVCDACYANPAAPVSTPGTSSSSTGSSVQSQDGYCAANPNSKLCSKDGDGSFGGSCTAGFQCSGDAVLCAAARGVHETKCALKPLDTDANNSVVKIGLDSLTGLNAADHPIKTKQSVSVGTFNTVNPFGAGCPPDTSLGTFLGKSIVVPLASACGLFTLMGQLLVGLTMLASALWLVKG